MALGTSGTYPVILLLMKAVLCLIERNLQLHRKHPFSGNLSASFMGSFEPDLGMWEGIPSQAEVINRISNPPPLILAG